MPSNKCLWLNHDQGFPPIEEPGKQDHSGADVSSGAPRLAAALLKQGELLAKEQVLGDKRSAGREQQLYELEHATFYKS